MKKLLELRQQKAALAEEMRNILNAADKEQRNLTEAEGKQFDELRAKADGLAADIARYEASAEEQRSAGGAPLQTKANELSNEEVRHWVKTGEMRSLSTTGDSGKDGGYSVIPQLDKQVMSRLTEDSVMRQICNVVKLPIGAKEYKKLVSGGGAVVEHGIEGTARGETATPKLNEVTIGVNSIYAYPKTTQEILDFSGIDILGWLGEEIAESFTETEDNDLVSGSGEKRSKGLLTYPRATDADNVRPFGTLQKMEVGAKAITGDTLIDLKFKLKSKYRKNAVWVMNSDTAAICQKLKNNNGDYLWRDGLVAGDPATLLGLPVYYLETMPNAEATKTPIAIGDFKRGYTIVDHETGVRTRPDNLTEAGFYKIHTDKYLGGGLVDSNAIKLLEIK